MSNWKDFQRFVNMSARVVADDVTTETIVIGHQKFYDQGGKIFMEPVDGTVEGQQISLSEAKKRALA